MKKISSLLLGMLLVGCEINSDETKIQYMPDMADAPTVKAQEGYIDPPPHSVPVNGILYPETIEDSERLFKNPLPVSEAHLQNGKMIFETFCAVCHGVDGKGQNALQGKYPTPPDISSAAYKERPDGFFFHRITFGSAIMPSYGHAIDPHERWQVIHYLRSLQK